MDGPASFVVSDTRNMHDGRRVLSATTTAPVLRGVVWTWNGGRLIDYGLTGHDAADCIGVVYDWHLAEPVTPFTMAGMSEFLADYYRDPVNLFATLDVIQHS